VLTLSSNNIWKRVKAWIAYWYSNGIVTFFLKQFDEYGFTVETSFAPASKLYSVDFSAQVVFLLNICYVVILALQIKNVPKSLGKTKLR